MLPRCESARGAAQALRPAGGGEGQGDVGEPGAATRWLAERDLAPEDAGLREMCAAQLREQIRALLAARVEGMPAPGGALAAVNDAMARTPTASLLCWDPVRGLYRESPHPVNRIVDHASAVLAANAADLLTGADAERLAACGSPPCKRYLLRTLGGTGVRRGVGTGFGRLGLTRAAKPTEEPAGGELRAGGEPRAGGEARVLAAGTRAALRGPVWRGPARRGPARRGPARRGPARPGACGPGCGGGGSMQDLRQGWRGANPWREPAEA
ncbi:ABATE domain-containing protein [Actinosynnema sp. CA-248983]